MLSITTDFADFGSDLRDLRKRLRAAGADIFDEFPKYATSLRRLLGIRSEQALELFHQTVSMKSVGNLNEFVRDHMLEPSDSSDRVRDIIAHFDDLTKAHDAVRRAREQLEALEPIANTAARYDAALAERDGLERERASVRLFIAELRSGLLAAEIAVLTAEGDRLWGEQDAAKAIQQKLSGERDALIEERAKAGGDRIGELERLAREAREQAVNRRGARTLFDAAAKDAGLEPITTGVAFAELATLLAGERPRLAEQKRTLDAATADAIGREKDIGRRGDAIRDEVTNLEQRTSNLPAEQVQLREQLCADLGLTPDDLPYAGELLDVRDEHADWRGAAERVLRGFALSLLVPQQHYDAVTHWVNGRRLTFQGRDGRAVGAKLVYERVPARRVPLRRQEIDALLLADCLETKKSPFEDYLRDELLKRADYRCAWTIEEFRGEKRAVTREGQVRSGERHEKDDRHRVDDPRRWVLGWVNERKIAALRGDLAGLESDLAAVQSELAGLLETRDALQRQQEALARLGGFHAWADLDVAEAEARAEGHDAERVRLEAGSSRLEEITQALARNEERALAVAKSVEDLTGKLATTAARAQQARDGQGSGRRFCRFAVGVGVWPSRGSLRRAGGSARWLATHAVQRLRRERERAYSESAQPDRTPDTGAWWLRPEPRSVHGGGPAQVA